MVIINAAAASYGLGGLLFALLTALLLTAWRGRLQGALLVTAAGVSTLWCAAHVSHALLMVPPFWTLQILELLRDAAWLAFLLALLGFAGERPRKGTWLRGAAAVVGTLLVTLGALYIVPLTGFRFGLDAAEFTRLTLLGHLGLAVVGLVLVHQLFRDTRPELRWAIKFLVFGLGGLFAYDLYLYSMAQLYNSVDAASWVARGLVNAIVVPFVAVAAVRNPTWSVEVFVSRQVVFHSTALLGVGVYLMLMAAAGYYIRLYGGDWGGIMQAAFLFLALLLLATLVVSGQVRARLRIFLNKHFFKNKYDYREEWLKFTSALSRTDADSDPRETIVRAVADLVEAPSGILWVRQPSDHFQASATYNIVHPGDVAVRPDSALVRFLERTAWVVYLDGFQSDPGSYPGLILPDWITELRTPWIIIPLVHGNELVAFVILTRPATPRDLNWEDTDLLKTCGRQAASYLALMRVSQALTDARQFDAFNRLSAYVVHDLKNLVAQLSLVVSNARRHLHSPGFIEDAIETVDNATQKMNRLLGQLRKGHAEGEPARSVNLVPIMEAVVASRSVSSPAPRLECDKASLPVFAAPERLAAVLEHLVQNAQEATPADGQVTLRGFREGPWVVLAVADTGCGMDASFISERLFRPFDTTKGNAGMGVGVYESREFVTDAGGELDVTSTPGQGTTFCLRLPLESASAGYAQASNDMEEVG